MRKKEGEQRVACRLNETRLYGACRGCRSIVREKFEDFLYGYIGACKDRACGRESNVYRAF